MQKLKVSEPDLLVYYLAVEKGYHDLLELYGLLSEFRQCSQCGHIHNSHVKIIREVVHDFGSLQRSIKVPPSDLLEQVIRDITIWKGISGCITEDAAAARAAEYSKRYHVTLDAIHKRKIIMQKVVDRLVAMKGLLHRQHGKNTELVRTAAN